MVRRLDAELAQRLAAIEYSPIAVVGFGYRSLARSARRLRTATTTASRQPILGVLWDSSIFPDRAPAGLQELRAMIGGQRNPELVDQDEAGLITYGARRDSSNHDGRRAGSGRDVREALGPRHPELCAGPHRERGCDLRAAGGLPGLYLNCNAYRGIAMNDCARNGRLLAERIAAAAAV